MIHLNTKAIVGSISSPKFREILNSFKDRLQDDARLVRSIEELDPRKSSMSGEFFILFDGKPGLFFYDGNRFIFTSAACSGGTKYGNILFVHEFNLYHKKDVVSSYSYDRESLASFDSWDDKTAALVSSFARNFISKCKFLGTRQEYYAHLANAKKQAANLGVR